MASTNSIVIRPLGALVQALQQYGRQLYQPPEDTIRDVDVDAWASPLQPVRPLAPEGAEPQAFQIVSGQNMMFTPRPDAEYSAADLKALATYPLARICVENVKDSLISASMEIQLKKQPGETKKELVARMKGNQDLLKLNRFFARPDRENDWDEWLRLILDDMLVGDYASVLIRKTKTGEVAEIPPIRGEMITRYVDNNGWTPLPPNPAYAQLWWGIPRVNLTTDQLVYKPRNIVPRNTMASQLYGMSPTEQLAPEIEIGIQRLEFVRAYYTEGSVPGVMQVVPKGVPAEKIGEAMEWMNSELAGNLAKRRQIRLIQGWSEKPNEDQIIMTKEALLSDPFDEQHMRRIAFGYGTSPQRLMKQMNRASSEQADDAAAAEGTRPYYVWVKSLVDGIIQRKFGYAECEVVLDPAHEPDAKKQAETLTMYVSKAILRPNEAREKLGEEEDPNPSANELGVITGTGFVTLAQMAEAHQASLETQSAAAEAARNPPPLPKPGDENQLAAGGKPNGATAAGGKPNGKPKPAPEEETKVLGFAGADVTTIPVVTNATLVNGSIVLSDTQKRGVNHAPHGQVKAVIHPGRLVPQAILAKHELERLLRARFKRMERKATRTLRKKAGIATKAAADDDAALQAILEELADEWLAAAEEAKKPLTDASLAGAHLGSLQLDINSEGLLAKINTVAERWAQERAAELVGMKEVDGELVDNPDARWAITDTTREKLKNAITEVFSQEAPTLADVERVIAESGAFSEERALLIAKTEIARAQSQSNLMSWRESRLVLEVEWQLSSDHDHDDICDDNEGDSPYKIGKVPEHPAHPACECVLVLSRLKGEPEES